MAPGRLSPEDDQVGGPRERARAELTWFLRHAAVLARWPVVPEGWARRIEERRLAAERPVRRE
jgi:hypothetical protein